MKVILGRFHLCYHFNTAYDRYYRYAHPFLESSSALSSTSPFSHEGSCVILKFGELKNLSDIRRAFRLKFFPKNPRDVHQLKAFQRLFRCFETSEATCPLTPRGRHRGRKMSPRLLVRGIRRRWHKPGDAEDGAVAVRPCTGSQERVLVPAGRRAGARHTRSHGFP